MQIAEKEGNRVTPSPGAVAVCPNCRQNVIAKCGNVNVWHWAHKSADCDPWHDSRKVADAKKIITAKYGITRTRMTINGERVHVYRTLRRKS